MANNTSRKSSLPAGKLSIVLQTWSSLYAKDLAKKSQLLQQGLSKQQASSLAYVHQKRYYDKVKSSPEFKANRKVASKQYYLKLKADPVRCAKHLEYKKQYRLKQFLNKK